MIALVFDIDGTLTTMQSIENVVLSNLMPGRMSDIKSSNETDLYAKYRFLSNSQIGKGKFNILYEAEFKKLQKSEALPQPAPLSLIKFIKRNKQNFIFAYCSGGFSYEVEYALEKFGILGLFKLENSISKDTYRFKKNTGLPFKRIKKLMNEKIIVIGDSESDKKGAELSQSKFIQSPADKSTIALEEFESKLKCIMENI